MIITGRPGKEARTANELLSQRHLSTAINDTRRPPKARVFVPLPSDVSSEEGVAPGAPAGILNVWTFPEAMLSCGPKLTTGQLRAISPELLEAASCVDDERDLHA